VNGGWDLGRDVVIRKRADQADGRIRRPRRDQSEIGMLGLAGFGQTVETTAEFNHATGVAQHVEGVGMHSERDEISGAKRAALVMKGLQRGIGIPGLHGG
jgi:hypothetical protein